MVAMDRDGCKWPLRLLIGPSWSLHLLQLPPAVCQCRGPLALHCPLPITALLRALAAVGRLDEEQAVRWAIALPIPVRQDQHPHPAQSDGEILIVATLYAGLRP